MGIRISKFDLEKSIEDFWATLERMKMAAKWDEATISAWEVKGRSVHGNVLKEVATAL